MGRFDSLPALPAHTFPAPAYTAYKTTGQTITANGDSGAIDVSDITVGHLVVFVTAVTGTTPTLNVFWDNQDANGNWILSLVSLTQLTAAPNYTHAVVGVPSPSGYPLTAAGRIRWTVGGTNPSWTGVQMSLIGR